MAVHTATIASAAEESTHTKVIESAKSKLDQLNIELGKIEIAASKKSNEAKAELKGKMAMLRAEWHTARAKLYQFQADAKIKADDAKNDMERRWDALQAAIATYRKEVENSK
jgi:hypothetical protein